MRPFKLFDNFSVGKQEYVFTLRIRQLLAHPDMQAVCAVLPNLTMVRALHGSFYLYAGLGVSYVAETWKHHERSTSDMNRSHRV